MPTKKGKSKPAKAKKASNKMRRDHPVGGAVGARGVGKTRGGRSNNSRRTTGPARTKTGAAPKAGGRRKAAGRLRKTEAGPVWIGSSPAPRKAPGEDKGAQKAGGGERVVIL